MRVGLVRLVDPDCDLRWADGNRLIGGDDYGPVHGGVERGILFIRLAEAGGHCPGDCPELLGLSWRQIAISGIGEDSIFDGLLGELFLIGREFDDFVEDGVNELAEFGNGFVVGFAGDDENGRFLIGEQGLGEPAGEQVGIGFRDVEHLGEAGGGGDGAWNGDGQFVSRFRAGELDGAGFRELPLLAGDLDGALVEGAEVDLVGLWGDGGGAGVEGFDDGGGAGLMVEGADDAAELLWGGEQAELLLGGVGEPGKGGLRVERGGGGRERAEDVGLVVLGKEECGAEGEFEQTGGVGGGPFGFVRGWRHLNLLSISIMGRGYLILGGWKGGFTGVCGVLGC